MTVKPKYERRKRLNLYLNWFSGGILVAMIVSFNWMDLLSVPAFACAGMAVFRMTRRGHFAFLGEKAYQDAGENTMDWLPWLPFCPLCLVIFYGIGGRQYFEIMKPLGYSLIAGLTMGLLMVLFVKEVRQSFDSALVMVVASVLLCAGIVIQGNHLLAGEPFVFHQVPILEMYESGVGNSADYNCVIQFPDGRTLTVDVGRRDYQEYKIGDTLTIPIRTGAFGIEYGCYGTETENR